MITELAFRNYSNISLIISHYYFNSISHLKIPQQETKRWFSESMVLVENTIFTFFLTSGYPTITAMNSFSIIKQLLHIFALLWSNFP